MSSKITVQEIIDVLDSLPQGRAFASDPLQAAMDAMEARESKAVYRRVIIYRFDDGDTTQADAYQAELQAGTLPLVDVARELDCDLQLIEIGSGAVEADDNARATAFGMMAAEEDTGLIAVAAFGAGSEERAGACDPARFFETATPETAAMLGAMIAAARAGIPIVAEGPQSLAAARALQHMRPDLTGHIFLCGLAQDAPGLHVFGDDEKNETGYASVMLAALIESAFSNKKAA